MEGKKKLANLNFGEKTGCNTIQTYIVKPYKQKERTKSTDAERLDTGNVDLMLNIPS